VTDPQTVVPVKRNEVPSNTLKGMTAMCHIAVRLKEGFTAEISHVSLSVSHAGNWGKILILFRHILH